MKYFEVLFASGDVYIDGTGEGVPDLEEKEEWLIERAAGCDQESFRKLVVKYQAKVFATCLYAVGNRVEAEDAAQEVFLQVFRSLGQYRGDSSFPSWLQRLTLNKCLDIRRKRARRSQLAPTISLPDDIVYQSEERTPEQTLVEQETSGELWRVIDRLPGKYRDVVMLYYMEQMTHHDIAQRLDIEVRSVATRLYRAKAMMKHYYREEGIGQ